MRGQGIEPTLHDVAKDPLSAQILGALLKKAGVKPSAALRKRDKAYKALGFDQKPPTDAQALKAMAKHPGLIQRPIVVVGSKAAIATTPDQATALL